MRRWVWVVAVGVALLGAAAVVDTVVRWQVEDRIAAEVTAVLEARDADMARAIDDDDDLLDRLHAETFAATLGGTLDLTAQQVVDITLAARYFERFGDHAVSVASRVVYLVTGTEYSHH